jgi:hypothetical protein
LLASDGHFWDFSGFFKGIFFDYWTFCGVYPKNIPQSEMIHSKYVQKSKASAHPLTPRNPPNLNQQSSLSSNLANKSRIPNKVMKKLWLVKPQSKKKQ